jgi:hypothetical protein
MGMTDEDRRALRGNGSTEPMALSIAGAVLATGSAVSRTRMFALIKAGEIDARRIGRRTVVMADSLRAYLDRAPAARSVA